MSKTWYPIIDYDKCTGCLACYGMCSHGVYELNTRDYPKVVFPEGCVHGCKGCGALCPQEAITYLGDNGGKQSDSGCCGKNDGGCYSGEKEEKSGGCDCGCC